MNRKQQSVLLASLMALALAGCSSPRGSTDTMPGAGGTASTGGSTSTSGGMATPADSSMAAQPQAQPQTQQPGAPPADTTMMPAAMPNAVVVSIEPMPRQGAMGGSGTAGATGSSMGDDKVYRITLRMDDGTTRVVTQEKAPTYRSGDRVNMMDGVISH